MISSTPSPSNHVIAVRFGESSLPAFQSTF
jgi:hypothetical protein